MGALTGNGKLLVHVVVPLVAATLTTTVCWSGRLLATVKANAFVANMLDRLQYCHSYGFIGKSDVGISS